jgi:hypothetical protein
MKVYRILWLAVCVLLAMIGASVAFVVAPLPMTVLSFVFAAISAIVAWTWTLQSQDTQHPPRDRMRVMTTSALVGGTTVGAFVGLTVLLGAGVFLLVIVVLASAPYALSAYGRWLRSLPTPSAAQLDTMARSLAYTSPEYLAFQPPSELSDLTAEELCGSWRASYAALQHQPSAAQTMATVAERHRYLDELERRNPSGFAAWLASGARTPGNPLPYLTRERAHHPAINWDELTRGQDW